MHEMSMHAQRFDWIEQTGHLCAANLAHQLPQSLHQKCHDHTGSRARTSLCTHRHSATPCMRPRDRAGEDKGIEEGERDRTRCASPIKCLARSLALMVSIFPTPRRRRRSRPVALDVSKYGSTVDRTQRRALLGAAGALTWLTLIAGPGPKPRPWPPFPMESRPTKKAAAPPSAGLVRLRTPARGRAAGSGAGSGAPKAVFRPASRAYPSCGSTLSL
jgi:hypothetical protein